MMMKKAALWALMPMLALLGAAGCQRSRAPSGTRRSPPEQGARSVASTAAPALEPADLTPKLGVPKVAEELTEAFAGAAHAIRGSVVRVEVERAGPGSGRNRQGVELPAPFRRFFDFRNLPDEPDGAPPDSGLAVGSGFVLDVAGHVLTNAHVVERAAKVTVQLPDNRKLSARVMGRDSLTDIAVLAIEAPPKDLAVARLGDSNQLRVGQWVLAVGSPLGLDQSVTAGIVSGLGRTGGRMRMSGERVRRYIQTDASINPGNSGGPLVTLAGEVVGVNTLIDVGPGGAYGFAIPIQQAAGVARTLMKDGRVRYPYLGVEVISLEDLPPELRERLPKRTPERGAYVNAVVAGGPAARAGLKPGDVIVKIGDTPVDSANDLIEAVSTGSIGAKVSLAYWRDGQQRLTEATIRELAREPGKVAASEVGIGVGMQTLTEPLAQSLGLPPATRGAVVTEVQADSPAARAGLERGDVIVEVDRKPVSSAAEAAAAIREGAGKPHVLLVRTASGVRFVTVDTTS
jgi:serine protease Do